MRLRLKSYQIYYITHMVFRIQWKTAMLPEHETDPTTENHCTLYYTLTNWKYKHKHLAHISTTYCAKRDAKMQPRTKLIFTYRLRMSHNNRRTDLFTQSEGSPNFNIKKNHRSHPLPHTTTTKRLINSSSLCPFVVRKWKMENRFILVPFKNHVLIKTSRSASPHPYLHLFPQMVCKHVC